MKLVNVCLAVYQLESELERELQFRQIPFKKIDRLYFLERNYCPLFAQVTWINCQTFSIVSIKDGITKLKALGKNWALFSVGNHRRAQLICERLARVSHDAIEFLADAPKYTMGGWTLLDANTIVCSPHTTSRYPLGKVEFIENKIVPPSRAYLKLWEFFTVHCPPPSVGTKVLDLGASPGGWSWVLSEMKLDVISVDKAPLEESIARIPNITVLQESAFGLDPQRVPGATWLFCDIICYPERLLSFIQKWMKDSNVRTVVCTIKFQGQADFTLIDQFLAVQNSKMVHLYHNKHELTWWKTDVK